MIAQTFAARLLCLFNQSHAVAAARVTRRHEFQRPINIVELWIATNRLCAFARYTFSSTTR